MAFSAVRFTNILPAASYLFAASSSRYAFGFYAQNSFVFDDDEFLRRCRCLMLIELKKPHDAVIFSKMRDDDIGTHAVVPFTLCAGRLL